MFDTFDLLLPELLPISDVEVRQRKSAFGRDEDRCVYVRDVELGRVVLASEAYSAVEAWTGEPDRGDWTVLVLSPEANAAAAHDRTWQAYLDGLLVILKNHPAWRVTCESDCEQYAREKFELSADGLVALLDSYRTTRHHPIAFYAEQI